MAEADRTGQRGLDQAAVARFHGVFNIVSGLWPLLSTRSFEAVFGRKQDRWLQYSVAGLLLAVGCAQTRTGRDPASLRTARTVGVGTALTLLSIDLRYAPQGRIPRTYLLDALLEAGWLTAWLRAAPPATRTDRSTNPTAKSTHQ
ncbi:hypothetical protein NI17_023470 [Thermobifida halotolerans]|uniref:Uncharacterized protein n=1 Tax=Thermobifida halotolerans TaxID=483545 RepID=A0AA97M410_9ACTN|nr:hypothetical protein [Thermobifida halotolerans]UOE19616.1 hypothetical protein NI17_023470 [Thermobifida halotolerans]